MDTKESSVPHAHPSTDDHDTLEAHYSGLERPYACTDGVVYIGHLVEDPGTGEETEIVEAVPCRRCADSRYPMGRARSPLGQTFQPNV
jgi:hypothetical protein